MPSSVSAPSIRERDVFQHDSAAAVPIESIMSDLAYFASNLAKNMAAPLLIPLRRSRGSYGLDGDPAGVEAVARRVVDLARCAGTTLRGSSVLELGPGRTPDLAMTLRLMGAARVLSLDTELQVGTREIEAAAQRVAATGCGSISEWQSLPTGTRFECYDGVTIPSPTEAFDLAFSKSVLEHVRLEQVSPLLHELARILRPGGVMVHIIDLRDHMFIDGDHAVKGNWLKALEYSERSFKLLFSNRSTCINRLRSPEWRERFTALDLEIVKWDELRLPLDGTFTRQALAPRWRDLSEDELRVAWITVVTRKPVH